MIDLSNLIIISIINLINYLLGSIIQSADLILMIYCFTIINADSHAVLITCLVLKSLTSYP